MEGLYSILILFIILYPFAVHALKKYHKAAHSKEGIWSSMPICSFDKFLIWCPIANVLYTIICWSSGSPYRKGRRKSLLAISLIVFVLLLITIVWNS